MSQRPAAVAVAETSGRLGEAGYLFLRPADWNGDLVPFGHAAESPFPPAGRFWFPLPLGFGPQTAGMPFAHNRDAALCHGFAWAASASERYGGAAHERAMADPSTLQRMASNHLPGSERFDPADVGHNVLWGDPTAPDAQAAFVSLGEGWSVEEIVDLNARVPRYASDPLAERYWTFH